MGYLHGVNTMTIIPVSYDTITQRTRGVYEPVKTVPPLLQWLVRRIEQRSFFIIGAKSPGVDLGTIKQEIFTRLYMGSVSLDVNPMHTTRTLKPVRDIFSLWVNIAPKEHPNATLKNLGVDRAGFYRFHFDTCFWANKQNVNVWGLYVPHIDNERTLKPYATWGGVKQRYIEYENAPITKLLGGSNE